MKRAILFVDDEPNVIDGLRRMLRNMRDRWEMYFAGSGEEALKILETTPIDVIVADMRMPQMDGATLLARVQERYPHVVRIMLTGHSDKEMTLRSTKSAHQFLAKPCDGETLRYTIERTCQLRELLRDKKLLQVVTGITVLPSLPSLYRELIKEMEAPNASLKKIGAIVTQDMAMTAKVLQLVNSAFFGLPQRVTNPVQAVTLLGLNNLRPLVLYIHLFEAFETTPGSGRVIEALWEHSVAVGSLAREIARLEKADREVRDEALTAGLLHDIGKLLLLRLPDCCEKLKGLADREGDWLPADEYALIGTSHAELGAYLLGLWGIADTVVEAVAFHHQPGNSVADRFTVLTAVHVANGLVKEGDCSLQTVDLDYLRRLGLEQKVTHWAELYREIKGGQAR
ncbi:response regulator [Thermodesulfitimonas autotrophica]|uniref:response regulator n=1 Tax=Thermodesulfitimonas autotrophica TaxID=1894989 RepID=UPI002FE0635E